MAAKSSLAERVPVRVSLPRYAAAGAGLGLAWGAALRGWMRFISPFPEFSWAGTGFILAVAVAAGLGLGVVEGARRSGRSRAWRLAALSGIGLFAGAGTIMAPTVVLGGLALSGRYHPSVRVVAAVVAITPISVLVTEFESSPRSPVVSAALYVVLVGLEALGFSVLFRRWHVRP